jgi:hypothetical protein
MNTFVDGLNMGNDMDKKSLADWKNLRYGRDMDPGQIVLEYLYFAIRIPKGQDHGCLILQKKGNMRVQNIFMHWLRESIRQYSDFKHVYPYIKKFLPK